MNEIDLAGYADDNAPFVISESIDGVSKSFEKSFEKDSIKLFKWLADNETKAQKNKCYFLINTNEKRLFILAATC